MLRLVLLALALGMFAVATVACHAEGDVGGNSATHVVPGR